MVDDVLELPPLGKSDHVCQKWNLVVSEPIFRNTTKLRYNFKRANWEEMKKELRNFELDSNDSPDTMNGILVEKIKELKVKHIPLCRPRSNKNRLPWTKGAAIKKQRFLKLTQLPKPLSIKLSLQTTIFDLKGD